LPVWAQQYKMQAAGAPPAEAAAVKAALAADGARITTAAGEPHIDVWLTTRALPPSTTPEENATLGAVKHGAFLGVARVGAKAQDRRGDPMPPGVYVMRLSFYPQDGAHTGVAPQRDFVILTRVADDTDVNATPKFEDLMNMARKASGTAHPLSLSCWKAEAGESAGFAAEGSDYVLRAKIGDTLVAIIVAGKSDH
jgi:hypothetical protein